jgi:putative ABC transport system permease protein
MISLQIAFRNLLASSRRTIFLGAALFLVTFLMVMLLSLVQGISDNLIRATTTVSSGHVNVGGFFKSTPGDSQTLITRTAEVKAVVKEALPDAVRIIDRSRGWGKIISDHGSVQAGINGINLAEEDALLDILSLAPAKDYIENAPEPEKTVGNLKNLKAGGIILFASQAKRLKVDVGDAVTLRTETIRGATNTADVNVVAIARDLGPLSSWATFVDKSTVAGLYQWKPDVSGAVQIYFKDPEMAEDGMNRLRKAMADKGFNLREHDTNPFFVKLQQVPQEDWVGQQYDLSTWRDEAAFVTWILTAISSVSFLLLSMLTLIIAVGIMNTMYIAVRERTKEIGTLRAIGMSRGAVLRLFLFEALTLGLVSTTAGALAGLVVAGALDHAGIRIDVEAIRAILLADTLHLAARVKDVVIAIVCFTGLAGISALFPALRASRVAPVTAMQSAD